MYRYKHPSATLGAMVLLILVGSMFTGQRKAVAEPLYYDFTYTATDTVKACYVMDTVQFQSLITNTGIEPDTYIVTRIENPPTPENWWVRFCVGGICWDSTVTLARVYLEPGESDEIFLDIIPRSPGEGNIKITVQSTFEPSISKSKTFLLTAVELFKRGDANHDAVINSADVAYLINYLFVGGPEPNPIESGDANCDGKVNSADVAYLINYLFVGGPSSHC